VPPVSEAQRRFFRFAAENPKASGVSKKVSNEFNSSDPGGKLPAHMAFGGSMAHGDPLGGLAHPKAFSAGSMPHVAGVHAGVHGPTAIHVGAMPHISVGAPPKPPSGGGQTQIPHAWFERAEARQMGKGFAAGGRLGLQDGGGVYPDVEFGGGLIGGSGGGRTDRLPLSVPNDSHVLTADTVSGSGQGHSAFGARSIMEALKIGPWGVQDGPDVKGHGPPRAPEVSPKLFGESSGGRAQDHGGRVGILAASGEMVIPRDDWIARDDIDGKHYLHRGVRSLGRDWYAQHGGHPTEAQILKKGHDLLDDMMARIRAFNIRWLQNAPKPKKSTGGAVGLALAA
jgi:hypothetical protein